LFLQVHQVAADIHHFGCVSFMRSSRLEKSKANLCNGKGYRLIAIWLLLIDKYSRGGSDIPGDVFRGWAAAGRATTVKLQNDSALQGQILSASPSLFFLFSSFILSTL
jgi:predicted alpha/beta hydrolase